MKLSSISKKLRSTTWDVLYKALCNWLKLGDQMQHPCLDRMFLKAGQRTLIETALQKQDKIGWKHAMRGYLSTSWVDMECYGKSGATPDSVRQNWLQPIIKAIWAFFNKTLWTQQNSILHSTTIPLRELRESSVNSQIQGILRSLFGGQWIDANRWLSIDCIAPKLNAMPSYAYIFNGGTGSSMLSQAWRKTSWSWLPD